jgi:hypothetical protein
VAADIPCWRLAPGEDVGRAVEWLALKALA